MSGLIRIDSFSLREQGEYEASPIRRAKAECFGKSIPYKDLTLTGNHASSFLNAAIHDKLSFLPRVRTRPLELLHEGNKVRVEAYDEQSSLQGAYLFEVTRIKTYPTFDALFKEIPWETIVPWVSNEDDAKRVCNSLPNADKANVFGVIALSLDYSHHLR